MNKVCYLLPQYDKNSAENFYHIINFLSKLGKEVELYVIIENSDKNPYIENVKKIYVINDGKKNNYMIRFYIIVKIYFELFNKGVTTFFSRASSTGIFPLVVANRVFNFNRSDVIFWSCGQDVAPLSFKPTKKNLKRIITKILSKFIFKGINYLATGPEIMVEYYNKQYKIPKEKIILLYNDISLKRFYPLSFEVKNKIKKELFDTEKKIILFVHTFNYSRGTDLLHKIALKLKKNNSNIIIVAIGREGDYSKQLEKEINEYEINEYLINLGTVANRDIVKYYQTADLFIMPSRGEGFPRVIIEAMSCKCVPISFDVGGVRNILHKSIVENTVVDLNNENDFIDKSINIISDDMLLKEYASLSYEKVQEYSTENVVEMYMDKFDFIKNSTNNLYVVNFKVISSKDIEQLVNLDKQTIEKYGNSYSNELWYKENFLYQLPQKNKYSYILKIKNEVFGFCVASLKKDTIYIHRFLVKQNSFNLSRIFFKNLMEYYRDKQLALMVNTDNIAAIDFYKFFEFKVIKENEIIKQFVSNDLEIKEHLICVEKDYKCCLMIKKA